MKTFLLAGGLGTRLRPITNRIPKCLVPVNDIPLLNYWISLFEKHKIHDILINIHHLPEKVDKFLNNYNGSLKFTRIYEGKLAGSLGTILNNKKLYKDENIILVCYADNLTNMNITSIIDYHKSHSSPITMGLFKTQYPSQCGIAYIDSSNTIVDFIEKPDDPESNLANAGVYVFNTNIFSNMIPAKEILDIGYDLLPKFTNNMKGYLIEDYIFDIGNIKKLEQAESYVINNPGEFEHVKELQ